MNSWNGIGNLTADPEVSYSETGAPTVKFRMAIDRGFGSRKSTDFIRVTVFGRDPASDGTSRSGMAESCAQYLRKGSKVGVHGNLKYSAWESNGQKRSALEIIADQVDFLTPRPQEDE